LGCARKNKGRNSKESNRNKVSGLEGSEKRRIVESVRDAALCDLKRNTYDELQGKRREEACGPTGAKGSRDRQRKEEGKKRFPAAQEKGHTPRPINFFVRKKKAGTSSAIRQWRGESFVN